MINNTEFTGHHERSGLGIKVPALSFIVKPVIIVFASYATEWVHNDVITWFVVVG